MSPLYQRTQKGTLILVVMMMGVLQGLLILLLVPFEGEDRPGFWILVATLLTLVVTTILFSSLTVTVRDGRLAWRFGPGLIRRSVPIDRIAEAQPTRTTLLSGWGIHWTRRGWLYNVSGLSAVHVRLTDGSQFLLGTDEPEELVAAIHAARLQRGAAAR